MEIMKQLKKTIPNKAKKYFQKAKLNQKPKRKHDVLALLKHLQNTNENERHYLQQY